MTDLVAASAITSTEGLDRAAEELSALARELAAAVARGDASAGWCAQDAVAEGVFPDHRSLSLLDRPTSDRALYRFPIYAFFALSIAAAGLGNARGAIDDLLVLAVGKVGQGSSRTLAQRPATWTVVAQAEASLRAARTFYYQANPATWELTGRLLLDQPTETWML
jgi:hypothetical protein